MPSLKPYTQIKASASLIYFVPPQEMWNEENEFKLVIANLIRNLLECQTKKAGSFGYSESSSE